MYEGNPEDEKGGKAASDHMIGFTAANLKKYVFVYQNVSKKRELDSHFTHFLTRDVIENITQINVLKSENTTTSS